MNSASLVCYDLAVQVLEELEGLETLREEKKEKDCRREVVEETILVQYHICSGFTEDP